VGEAIDAMLAQRGSPATGLLFLTERRRALHPAWSFRMLKRLGRIASVPQAEKLSAHSLRATAITELLNAGVTLRDVQDFARHPDPRTTRRYDKQRGSLDRAGSYVLATRYGPRHDP
jgi:integrase